MAGATGTCKCTSEKCGHENGEPCGNPIENPQQTAQVDAALDKPNPVVGPWYQTGLCEECWTLNNPPELDSKMVNRLFEEES
jgi:hypothetical protein